jgi:hypothetical protein
MDLLEAALRLYLGVEIRVEGVPLRSLLDGASGERPGPPVRVPGSEL